MENPISIEMSTFIVCFEVQKARGLPRFDLCASGSYFELSIAGRQPAPAQLPRQSALFTFIVMKSSQSGQSNQRTDRSFWEDTGEEFPAFCEASSTRYYFDCERFLFEEYFPDLQGKRILKTDLWDEAKNSRILRWAATRGAEVFGLDISSPILRGALCAFQEGEATLNPRFILSDVRSIGLASNSFDYLYIMGTVEHSPEYKLAIEECFRVLRPGGRAIIGVPNKLDPFLRPAFVSLLSKFGYYGYGYELSFSAPSFNRILRQVGFKIIDNSGILFMPGLLRMADLYCFCYMPWATRFTAPLIVPFAFLYRRFPWLRRHGYLIASVVEKP
jgi:SAM-dependent methyltransferase